MKWLFFYMSGCLTAILVFLCTKNRKKNFTFREPTVHHPKAILMKAFLRPCFVIFTLSICISAYPITIYEINYEFKNLTEFPRYNAFLVRYGNGTGFMRVKYSNKANTQHYVVHMEFSEVEG